MVEVQVLASAVIIPEAEDLPASPPLSAKRRHSSGSLSPTKRSKLSPLPDGAAAKTEAALSATGGPPERQIVKDVDERKRGKRLFGALLGTLANNSASTAQRRRVDIEKKQKEKLKLQAEEDDHKKKARLNDLVQARRQEQKNYDRQSMLLRHSNTVATARFLYTKADPRLYYKPWELLPEEEARIKTQIEEAEAAIDHELQESQTKVSESSETATANHPTDSTDEQPEEKKETVGDAGNRPEPADPSPKTDANVEPLSNANGEDGVASEEAPKDLLDDGADDVVEGEEDTVIY